MKNPSLLFVGLPDRAGRGRLCHLRISGPSSLTRSRCILLLRGKDELRTDLREEPELLLQAPEKPLIFFCQAKPQPGR